MLLLKGAQTARLPELGFDVEIRSCKKVVGLFFIEHPWAVSLADASFRLVADVDQPSRAR